MNFNQSSSRLALTQAHQASLYSKIPKSYVYYVRVTLATAVALFFYNNNISFINQIFFFLSLYIFLSFLVLSYKVSFENYSFMFSFSKNLFRNNSIGFLFCESLFFQFFSLSSKFFFLLSIVILLFKVFCCSMFFFCFRIL